MRGRGRRAGGEPATPGAGATQTSRYTRAIDGTLLSRLGPAGRRDYLYDGEGTVVGLTDPEGELRTSYTYEPYGHPANLTSLGDPNPFGYLGAYTAGVQGQGVLCGGPNLLGGSFYDPEDGRNTQTTLVASDCTPYGSYVPSFRLPSVGNLFGGGCDESDFGGGGIDLHVSPGDVLDTVNGAAGEAQQLFNDAKRTLRSPAGRCAIAGGIVGAGVVALTKNPGSFTASQRATATGLGASVGCGAGVAKKLP